MIQDFQRHFTLAIFVLVNINCWTFKCFYELFKSPEARTASFALGKIQNWLVGRVILQIEWKYYFSNFFAQSPLLCLRTTWWQIDLTEQSRIIGEFFFFLNRAKNDIKSVRVLYSTANEPQPQIMPKMDHKWSSAVNDPQIGPHMELADHRVNFI